MTHRKGARLGMALAGMALAAMMTGVPTAQADAVNVVQVRNFRYEPQELRIEVGQTVRWTAVDTKHTVTAQDGRFDFFANRTLNQGESVEFTFREDATVFYACRIHAPSMAGVIIVGLGSPPPPPPPPPPAETREVPTEYPTVADALRDAPAGTTVRLAPGRYTEEVRVDRPAVSLEGAGTVPSDVVIDGEDERGTGILVTAPGVSIRNLQVRDHTVAGVAVEGASGALIDGVEAQRNGSFGILLAGALRGVVQRSTASRSSVGVSVQGCDECDVLVQDVVSEHNRTGFLGRNAGSVTLRDSRLQQNGTGVTLRTDVTSEYAPQRGGHIVGNVIAHNRGLDVPAPASDLDRDVVGAGVWIDGGWHNTVEGNAIDDQQYAVAVTGMSGPVFGNRIVGNVITGSRQADLGWDGIGANTCFSANTGPMGEPFSEPRLVQVIYPCSAPATIGMPWPKVDVDLLAYAVQR